MLYPALIEYCTELLKHVDEISAERKEVLDKLTNYIQKKIDQKEKRINLIYICTHNSRRSHFGQVWAAVAADYFNIENVATYSGGTEATAFNINAINALKKIGFVISSEDSTVPNPIYKVAFGATNFTTCFSKVFDDSNNPSGNFAAIMTCSDAEENCPFIPGVDIRIATTYDDPKAFDTTSQQEEKYIERCRQIALETLYAFSGLLK